jgi:hypothetical protein
MQPQHYQLASGSQVSGGPYSQSGGISPSFSDYPSTYNPNYAAGLSSVAAPPTGNVPSIPSYAPGSTAQVGSPNPSFSR